VTVTDPTEATVPEVAPTAAAVGGDRATSWVHFRQP